VRRPYPAAWRLYGTAALVALVAGALAGRQVRPVPSVRAEGVLWMNPALAGQGADLAAGQGVEQELAPGAKPLKVGFIRSELILQLHPQVPEIRTAYERQIREWQNRQQEMQNRIETLQTELRTQQLTINGRRTRETELAQLLEDVQTFQAEVWSPGGRAEQKEAELMQPIFDAVDQVISSIAEGERYDLIFDGSAGGLLFGHIELDLTRIVLERLGIEPPSEE